ncbi:hypothetical protein BGZ61DRAFT_469095 [Ilyonectria robusta]|uniref:uncharacterized protein n=1 Tax=Ilyonectria robusta TaxID=1079257 RepID=UPI001E8EA844|nr:uncharacterized protein BGZ61DRAFT_469095 [Ilyonectria robusta]KAH8651659.1 hypothetical protein BGZ61DRAFT_469095 [Ilyonectria robusta]
MRVDPVIACSYSLYGATNSRLQQRYRNMTSEQAELPGSSLARFKIFEIENNRLNSDSGTQSANMMILSHRSGNF